MPGFRTLARTYLIPCLRQLVAVEDIRHAVSVDTARSVVITSSALGRGTVRFVADGISAGHRNVGRAEQRDQVHTANGDERWLEAAQ
jgi:hypothetical protein